MFKKILSFFYLTFISWAITLILVYLIALCFSIKITILIGTGVWLSFVLINLSLSNWRK